MATDSNEIEAIGGYFEMAERELQGRFPVDGIRLNTCRNALEYIILSLPDVRHIYLPLYTCEAVVQPFSRLQNIGYTFYRINEQLEMAEDISLKEGEYLIANNYFGIKDAYIAELAKRYGRHLIVDNAQALFTPALPGIKAAYSVRKFVGAADGGFAVGVNGANACQYAIDDSSEHDSHLLIRKQQGAEAGFKDYQQNECKLDNQPIRRMSSQTEDILTHIDYESVIARRRANFDYLHNALASSNQLQLPSTDSFVCPMVFPYMVEDGPELRNRLITNKVFVARYWPNVLEWASPDDIEHRLTTNLLPLPIDQRYGENDMKRIIRIIEQ
ncbi:MAG: hypothetical protein Q4D14_00565 [Bacteroidales bacterium]|nr:hypothetical protein [Bacteroidales bacterium]